MSDYEYKFRDEDETWDEFMNIGEDPITQRIESDHILYRPITGIWSLETGKPAYSAPNVVFLTTDPRWSGYSEYTITSTWNEFHVSVGEWEKHWVEGGKFFSDLARGHEVYQW